MKKRINTAIILATILTLLTANCVAQEKPKLQAGVSRALAEEIEVCISKQEAPEAKEPVLVFEHGYTTARVNVRELPSTDSNIYEVYILGQPVIYAKHNEEWSIIKYGDSYAYIYSEYITDKEVLYYNEYNVYLLSHLIMGEAENCDDKTQLYVGSVALNRVKSKYFPNTLKDVIFQDGQYACTWDGNFYKEPTEQCLKNAVYLASFGSVLPENVIWQAGFKQGDGVYAERSGMYFCYSNF